MFPEVGKISLMSIRASVDLPQPDSPTMASVSPFCTDSDTFDTARSVLGLAKSDPPTLKSRVRLTAFRIVSAMRCAPAASPAAQSDTALHGLPRSPAEVVSRCKCPVRKGSGSRTGSQRALSEPSEQFPAQCSIAREDR